MNNIELTKTLIAALITMAAILIAVFYQIVMDTIGVSATMLAIILLSVVAFIISVIPVEDEEDY